MSILVVLSQSRLFDRACPDPVIMIAGLEMEGLVLGKLFGSSRVDVRGSPGIEAARQPWREFSEETKRLDRKEIVKTCIPQVWQCS